MAYERVFSWLDADLKTTSLLSNSVATTLNNWNTNSRTLTFPSQFTAPYVVTNDVFVGDRIGAPAGEIGGDGSTYLAGISCKSNGISFDPHA